MKAQTQPGMDTRQRLIGSARELIYARSYADVGVQAICEHAQVKKGSFYHFFPSKKDLTLTVLDELFLEFKTGIVERAFSADISPMQRFSRMVEMVYQFHKAIADSTGQVFGCPFGNLSSEMSTQDEQIRLKISLIFDDLQVAMKQALDDAAEQGDVNNIDTAATAAAMFAYIEGVILMAKTKNDVELIRTLAPAVIDIRIPQNNS